MERSGADDPGQPDVETLLAELTLEEKVSLLAGRGMWVTMRVPRLGIPAIKVTDGPNGARGDGASGASAASFPVGSALASTWNTELVEAVGQALGEEARTKNAQVLLGPTVNLHRTPLGGRNFECYSEDPYLTAYMARAFIRGVQQAGVGACIKHLVCNDSEFERHSISSDVDPRTLRELYLLPFEIAIRDARPWCVMSAYNRVNGTFASSHRALLRDVLKGEWGFDGVVMSDWGAALETEANLSGGLDLEMPGPTRTRGQALLQAVQQGRVDPAHVDDGARRLLRLIVRSGRFAEPAPKPEVSDDRPAHRRLARRAAAEGMVLLANRGVLPLNPDRIRRLAVLGPNAARGQIQGGGSSAVFPHYRIMPLAGLTGAANWQVVHAPGCFNHKYLPLPEPGMLTHGGEPGARILLFNPGDPTPAAEQQVVLDFNPMGGLPLVKVGGRRSEPGFRVRIEADFVPDRDGIWQFGLLSAGRSRLFIDDVELIDNADAWQRGDAFFTRGSSERRADFPAEAERRYQLRIDYEGPQDHDMPGIRYGILPPQPDDPVAEAAALARSADATVLVVGSDPDWETEGNDRRDLSLPGQQNALIEAVLAADPQAVVVLNTGAVVDMPWLERAGAVIQAWLPGQEFGNALADVVTGRSNPAGRMPCTVPRRIEDTPAFTSYPGDNGHVLYGERGFVGYRWYDSRGIEPLVPFGHGLSYTRFEYADLELQAAPEGLAVHATIRNAGAHEGPEVVQLYLAPQGRYPVQRPDQELRDFRKVTLAPGEQIRVRFVLSLRDFAIWNIEHDAWQALAGSYQIRLGASSRDIRLRQTWRLAETCLL